ncbi:putative Protein kinase C theta type [Blattamonas nauphoetae]|uniref:Protein kinase domain-containing protein n=1 Tax=Blattamonas nauphoetae TaxID=2049346 RepID=A0ABQ9Y679_9EUKA|nr:putative Protein kinase C theta type [Blattamonas nauphoetae]
MSNPQAIPQQTVQQILHQKGYQNPLFLGQGQFGAVYRVEKDYKFFAAKLVLTERVAPGELRAGTFLLQKGLTSQYLVNFLEHVLIPPYTLFVMDFANLQDLSESHKITPQMPPSTVFMIAYQILGGLSVMHQSGLIHRDIKPDNVLFHYDHDLDKVFAKISDFGTATDLKSRNETQFSQMQKIQLAKTFAGTPIYMAPEVAIYGEDYGYTVDCWAVGIMIFQFLYGKHPFNISSYLSMARSIEQGVQFPENPYHPNNPEWVYMDPLNFLIKGLLEPKPQNRLRARDAISLECFRNLWDLPNPSLTWPQYTALMKNPYLQHPTRPTLPNVVPHPIIQPPKPEPTPSSSLPTHHQQGPPPEPAPLALSHQQTTSLKPKQEDTRPRYELVVSLKEIPIKCGDRLIERRQWLSEHFQNET